MGRVYIRRDGIAIMGMYYGEVGQTIAFRGLSSLT